jgi:acyl carrier protein
MKKEANNIQKLKSIFEKNLNQKIHNIENIKLGKTKNWDSLRHIQIMINIEKEFNIKINTSEVAKLNDFIKIKEYLLTIK